MSRSAVDVYCPKCRQPTLVGLSDDRAGYNVRVDPWPLTRGGELLAVVDRRTTFGRDRDGSLHRRCRWQIRATADRPVLAEHRCSSPLPFGWRAPTVTTTAATPTEGPMF